VKEQKEKKTKTGNNAIHSSKRTFSLKTKQKKKIPKEQNDDQIVIDSYSSPILDRIKPTPSMAARPSHVTEHNAL
jgi:hypothetical protein